MCISVRGHQLVYTLYTITLNKNHWCENGQCSGMSCHWQRNSSFWGLRSEEKRSDTLYNFGMDGSNFITHHVYVCYDHSSQLLPLSEPNLDSGTAQLFSIDLAIPIGMVIYDLHSKCNTGHRFRPQNSLEMHLWRAYVLSRPKGHTYKNSVRHMKNWQHCRGTNIHS